ncbi:unnamed protein product [Orchesella dallaii]|uniref:C2H2-type domain-containing protein n=1 Tax=Orchesella dallaii TaxID=48710 RepID=A0ABP1RE23_9HEXA
MMDLNDDLCRTDFFDFVKLDSGSNGLTPVAFIDSLDYTQTDGNNNLSATGGQIKTILDEMLLSDTLGSTSDPLQSNQGSLELLGSIQWPSSNHLDNGLTPTTNVSSDPSPNWLLSSGNPSDGEVTTLTNLLDPLFVSYDDSKMDHYFSSTQSSDPSNPGAISSDLITTTFMNDSSTSPTTSSENDLMSWQKSSSDVFCDESLLRSALQAGHNKVAQQIQIPTTVMAVTQKLQQHPQPGTTDMTELRKVLSFPPLANGNGQVTITTSNSSVVSTGSPTSSDQIMTGDHTNGGVGDLGGDGQYYELKVLDSVFVDPDTVIPNVEELIMTRITPQFNGVPNGMKKGIEISEKKINSTTLSAKWTYTTNNDQNKTPRKRNKKNNGLKNPPMNGTTNGALPSTLNCDNRNGVVGSLSPSVGSPKSSQSSPSTNSTSSSGTSGATSRKERSLHYCNICCKGFKDKYSVNVHVRTHTGEKPFSCTLCGKNFRQKAHLAKHYQTHAAKANNPHGKGSAKRTVSVAAS